MLNKLMQQTTRFLVGALLAAGLAASPAAAIDPMLQAAQEEGLVGERADGYLGIVDNEPVDDAIIRRVSEVNALRRDVYTRKAQQTGESLSVIAALAAEIQYSRLAPGACFMNDDGQWVQK